MIGLRDGEVETFRIAPLLRQVLRWANEIGSLDSAAVRPIRCR